MVRLIIVFVIFFAWIVLAGISVAHDSILDQVDDSRPIRQLDQFFRILYSFEMFKHEVAIGVSLRPDLHYDLYGDGSTRLIDPKLWFKPAKYLGRFGTPIEEAVYELIDTPRVFSIAINF